MSANIISYHFTKKKAQEIAKKETRKTGRSSGWSHIDYTVVPSNRIFRRWGVRVRSR